KKTEYIFEKQAGLNLNKCDQICQSTLSNCDHGELYLEHRISEMIALDDRRIRTATFDVSQGFGFRGIKNEVTAYAFSSNIDEKEIANAAQSVKAVEKNYEGTFNLQLEKSKTPLLYTHQSPIEIAEFDEKSDLLKEIDAYARALDPRVNQVSAAIFASWQAVRIIRPDGQHISDIRPLFRMNISLNVESNGRMESGSSGSGGRADFADYLKPAYWKTETKEALRQALVNLDASHAPGGKMVVVLGSGWPGILLHEAVGHGLEGDFNRKGTSAFSNLMGTQVAAKGVSVIDDGTIAKRRGSINIDDEGTPSHETVLIEDGILTGYLQDRMNAGLMGTHSTGNGRRESYAHAPMPRMTNTFMRAGDKSHEEIISSVKKGIYAVHFGGGQVDITNGKFVFSCTEAYQIENGKITNPIKGTTLIGNGPDCMKKITMIGDDLQLDRGVGTCGKNGANNHWSAKGKTLIRRLREENASFAQTY
ncbi:MAG: metallopeptidase TldD-related protein, partial [Pseudomonadota bacterium]